MAKVKYLGAMDHRHRTNATGTEYFFHVGVFTEVKKEDAVYYAEEALNHAGPWEVEIGVIEKVTEIVRDAAEALGKDEKPKSKWKYGGKK